MIIPQNLNFKRSEKELQQIECQKQLINVIEQMIDKKNVPTDMISIHKNFVQRIKFILCTQD